ncbi:hypothetical protein M8J76_009662 [Diaphorina citri]|nr:hypothetical protein M8J76_009662 [Diaphorina citri]
MVSIRLHMSNMVSIRLHVKYGVDSTVRLPCSLVYSCHHRTFSTFYHTLRWRIWRFLCCRPLFAIAEDSGFCWVLQFSLSYTSVPLRSGLL